MATKTAITNTTVLALTAKGLAYTGRSGTAYNTAQQWQGCMAAFGKNPKVGSTCTVAQMLQGYIAANPQNVGNALANIKYHINSQRITAKA